MTGVYFLSWIPQVHFLTSFFSIISKTGQYTLMGFIAKVKLELIQNSKTLYILSYELKKTHA